MSIINRLNRSKRKPKSTFRSPTVSQLAASSRFAGSHPAQAMKITLSKNDVMTAAIESEALSLRSCCVNRVMTVAATSGRKRMTQGSAFMGLIFHERQVFNMRCLALAIERDDQRQADRHFCRRHRDDEKDEHLAIETVPESRKSDQRQVAGIEHQFERHVDHQQIAPHDD